MFLPWGEAVRFKKAILKNTLEEKKINNKLDKLKTGGFFAYKITKFSQSKKIYSTFISYLQVLKIKFDLFGSHRFIFNIPVY